MTAHNDAGRPVDNADNVVEGEDFSPFEDALLTEGEPPWERMGKIARLCVSGVEKHFGEKLDYTPASISQLDRVILSGWGEKKGEIPLNVSVSFGAYLGEVLARRTSGRWVSGITEEEPASILFLRGGEEAVASVSPFMLIREKLADPWNFDLSLAWTALDQKLKELGAI